MGEAKKLWGKMKERVGLEEIRPREDRESWSRFGGWYNEEVKKEEEMTQEQEEACSNILSFSGKRVWGKSLDVLSKFPDQLSSSPDKGMAPRL